MIPLPDLGLIAVHGCGEQWREMSRSARGAREEVSTLEHDSKGLNHHILLDLRPNYAFGPEQRAE